MDTRSLRYFQTVAEFGSYSRGAQALRISQPAVSRQIRAIEQELGEALFLRHSHGVSLTDAGRTLLERSQAILRQLDLARDEIRNGRQGLSGMVTIAVPPAAGASFLPELTRRFAALHPNVFLKVLAGFSVHIQEWLLRGRVDLACLHDPIPQPGFTMTPLVREEVFVVGRTGSLRPTSGQVSAAQLASLPLVLPSRPNASRRLLDAWLAEAGVELTVRMEADDHLILRALLREGVGFSLLTQGSFRAELALGEFEVWPLRPRAFWNLALMTPPAARQSGPAQALAQLIIATAGDLIRAGGWPGARAPLRKT